MSKHIRCIIWHQFGAILAYPIFVSFVYQNVIMPYVKEYPSDFPPVEYLGSSKLPFRTNEWHLCFSQASPWCSIVKWWCYGGQDLSGRNIGASSRYAQQSVPPFLIRNVTIHPRHRQVLPVLSWGKLREVDLGKSFCDRMWCPRILNKIYKFLYDGC